MDRELIVDLLSLQELDGKIAATGTATKRQSNRRVQLVARLPVSIQKSYERLQGAQKPVVVPCSGGYCMGCQMRVPPYVANRVEHAGELERCERCGRFLHGPVNLSGKKRVSEGTEAGTGCLLK